MSDEHPPELEIEKEKEIEIDIEKDLEKNTLKIIVDEYQSRISPIDGIQFETLKEFITLDGMEPDVVLKAISLAADNGKRNFSYIRAILQNWKNDGLLSIAAVNERERKFQESKTKGQPTKQQSNVPDWSKPNYTNQTSDQEKKALEEAKNEIRKGWEVMFILKHGSKQAKPFVKSVVIGTTGLDVSYSEESKAMKFVTRGVAIQVGNALRKSFGTFYPVEIDN